GLEPTRGLTHAFRSPLVFFKLRSIGLDFLALIAGLISPGLVQDLPVQSTPADAIGQPSAPRQLSGDDSRRVDELKKTIDQLRRAGKFTEVIEPAQKVLEICLKALGPDHWQTADGRRAVEDYRTIARLPEEGRKALASTRDLEEKANAAR